ncbi:unnamed protein product [Somion occarium]|uniref:Uncharacterized protein n=1 Tax=Somion occarium TaxID=3059160 RepID=A0ABP1DH79_9APHY
MYALKTPSFLRPTSRPSSPAPPVRQDSAPVADRPSFTSMLSFPTFKRTASPLVKSAATVVQDGSYMDVLNLKLSEAVTKALNHPTGPGPANELLNGRRPIPAGRGRALGELIVSELNASCEDSYLHRAVIRTLRRPLSVLVNNMSTNLLPLISSSAFLLPAAPTQQNPNLNPTQLHAVALATFAGELVDVFDQNGLGQEADSRGDGLRVTRDGLVSIVKRVIEPLMNAIRNEPMPHVEALEKANNAMTLPSNAGVAAKSAGATKTLVHPSIVFMQSMVPIYSRAVARYATSSISESMLTSLLLSLIWRGLVALSNRPNPTPSPPTSPALTAASVTLKVKDRKRRGSSETPPTTPPASRFTLKLPPSRPPSPPSLQSYKGSTAAGDARTLYDLMWSLPKPSESNRLAFEAVMDAFDALSSLAALLDSVQARLKSKVVADPNELARDLEVVTVDCPTLVALPILLRTYVFPVLSPAPALLSAEGTQLTERTVASMLGLTEAVYRAGCISGFSRAEECTIAVGQRILAMLREELAQVANANANAVLKEAYVVLNWLEREIAIVSAEAAESH